jgi:hypothetical protein
MPYELSKKLNLIRVEGENACNPKKVVSTGDFIKRYVINIGMGNLAVILTPVIDMFYLM